MVRRGLGEVSILYRVVREGLAVKVSRNKQRLNDVREGAAWWLGVSTFQEESAKALRQNHVQPSPARERRPVWPE